MSENTAGIKEFLGKVLISGRMEVVTGLHIGASKETVKIGGIDSPVVRDPVTNLPYVPGSSLKGKMRSLMEKALGKESKVISKQPLIRLHVCGDENCEVCRLFGSSVKEDREQKQKHIPARLIVRDLHLINSDDLEKIDTGLPYTEWKFENSIDRVTSAANPRQIERVPAGAVFGLELVYDAMDKNQLEKDIENIQRALRLLENDALGGHGSRGYGQVRFHDISFDVYPKAYYASGDETKLLKATSDVENVVSALK